MRKNILALSIATMIGGLGVANAAVFDTALGGGNAVLIPAGVQPATALQVAPGGIGHSLITPYYTVQNGNMTVLSIVNTDAKNGKAVKVRFRSGANSDDVLDFQVFMSPNDHWSAAVAKNPVTGVAMLVTGDKTCTVPPIPSTGVNFTTGRLPSFATTTEGANLTAEGYVEIFNMADIPKNDVAAIGHTTTLYQSILHTAGVPRNCGAAAVQDAPLIDAASAAAAVQLGFMAPTTGLFGGWSIINVPQTTTFTGEMTAIRAVDAGGQDGYGNYVYSPQSAADASGNIDSLTADPLLRSVGNAFLTMGTGGDGGTPTTAAAIAPAFYDLPDMSTPYVPGPITTHSPLAQAFALTSALAVKSISNEYTNETSLTASTDWSFSMPTRRYSVGVLYGNGTPILPNALRFSSVANATGSRSQANLGLAGASTQYFHSGNSKLSGYLICVNSSGQRFFDREEQASAAGNAVFSPGQQTTFSFCGETSVTTFSSTTASTLGSLLNPVAVSSYANGWARIDSTTTTNNVPSTAFTPAVPPVAPALGAAAIPGVTALPVNTGQLIGLPIMGAAFMKLNNPNAAAGKAGTYGLTFNHRYQK